MVASLKSGDPETSTTKTAAIAVLAASPMTRSAAGR
jgi:hypothetical protein